MKVFKNISGNENDEVEYKIEQIAETKIKENPPKYGSTSEN